MKTRPCALVLGAGAILGSAPAAIADDDARLTVACEVAGEADHPTLDRSFPNRVHVFEDFETEIEKRWWLRGTPERVDPAPSLSSIPNRRALRASASKDFDRKMGDPSKTWKAVIFNPVPGPPMGARTRLSFRYRLKGTDTIRAQIYSLTNNYHRRVRLPGLSEGAWASADIDLTKARRPDGTGGPLGIDERIDDIQFYIAPEAELLIDDIVLYDAVPVDEKRTESFPRRIIFTAWFDTGVQGKEWPGKFRIVPHEKPLTWDAAKAVATNAGNAPSIVLDLRGARPLGTSNALKFRYLLSSPGSLNLTISDLSGDQTNPLVVHTVNAPKAGAWSEVRWEFECAAGLSATHLEIRAPQGADLLVDDVLLYEPEEREPR